MPSPAELERLLSRLTPLRLLRGVAERGACDLAICGPGGSPLEAPEHLRGLRVTGTNGTIQVEGIEGAAAFEVAVFDQPVGYVVATPSDGGDGRAAAYVARHGANVLSALCSREYELNDLSREILASYEELNLFYDLAAELAGAPDVDAICDVTLDRALRVIGATRGWMLLAQDEGRSFRVVATRGVDDAPTAVVAEPSLAYEVAVDRMARVVESVAQHDPVDLGELERLADFALITVPLCVPGGDGKPAFGVLQLADKARSTVDPDDVGAVFTSGDLKLAQALGNQAAILVENTRLAAYEREMRIARTIQQSLLPGDPPRILGLDVAGACEVASNVGGDYYDHVAIDDRTVGLLLADVSGHNLAAALMQTAARSTFRAAMMPGSDPLEVIDRTNRVLYDDLSRSDLFLTAWLGYCTVDGELTFGDAGHHPAMLFRARTGEVEPLSAGGVPIGVLRDGLYTQETTQLEPGDALLIYTDGLSEARAPGLKHEEYGEARLEAALRDVAHRPANEIVQHLLGAVALFDGGQSAGDDRTLLCLKLIEGDSRC